MRRRGCRQDIGDEALVPASDGVVHRPVVPRAPVPVQDLLAVAGVPAPVDRLPQPVDRLAQARFSGEVLPRAEQPRYQEGGFDQVAAVILRREGYRGAGPAMQKMRKDAVVGFDLAEKRSEEHTSELQSLMRHSYDVFCLKKKKNNN